MYQSRVTTQHCYRFKDGKIFWYNVGGQFENRLREKYPQSDFIEIITVSKIKPFWLPIRTHWLYKQFWKTMLVYKWLIFLGAPQYRYVWWQRRYYLIMEDPKLFFGY